MSLWSIGIIKHLLEHSDKLTGYSSERECDRPQRFASIQASLDERSDMRGLLENIAAQVFITRQCFQMLINIRRVDAVALTRFIGRFVGNHVQQTFQHSM